MLQSEVKQESKAQAEYQPIMLSAAAKPKKPRAKAAGPPVPLDVSKKEYKAGYASRDRRPPGTHHPIGAEARKQLGMKPRAKAGVRAGVKAGVRAEGAPLQKRAAAKPKSQLKIKAGQKTAQASPWVLFLKKYSYDMGIPYGEAMKSEEARKLYRDLKDSLQLDAFLRM